MTTIAGRTFCSRFSPLRTRERKEDEWIPFYVPIGTRLAMAPQWGRQICRTGCPCGKR